MDKNDWYPYFASDEVIEALLVSGIQPAKCWVSEVSLSNGVAVNDAPVVAIWGRDVTKFLQAVRKVDRKVEIPTVAMSGTPERMDLATLAKRRGVTV